MPRVHSPLARQHAMKFALVHAVEVGDAHNSWASITVHESCQSVLPKADRPPPPSTWTDDFVRLLTLRNGLYLFISDGLQLPTLQRDMYLLRASEFYVHWVGEGPNKNGFVLRGHVLEGHFFRRQDEEDEEDEEYCDSADCVECARLRAEAE